MCSMCLSVVRACKYAITVDGLILPFKLVPCEDLCIHGMKGWKINIWYEDVYSMHVECGVPREPAAVLAGKWLCSQFSGCKY